SRAMRDEAKRARCRDGRIELAHAPRRRIPRIRIRLLAGGRRALVQGSEFTLLKEDLTTDFQTLGDTQPLRFPHWNGEGDGGNRFDVLRDVLALDAVPPRSANGQFAMIVGNRDCDAIQFELGRHDRLYILTELRLQTAAASFIPGEKFAFVECVRKRQHGHWMAHLLESIENLAPYAVRRGIRCDHLGMRRLDLLEAAK